MQDESQTQHHNQHLKYLRSPSTAAKSDQNGNQTLDLEIQEFSFASSLTHLNKMMSNASLDEKENQKHITDRFIPIRKTVSLTAQSFNDDDFSTPDRVVGRGQELNQSKMTMNQMYKMLVLQPTQEKVLNFKDKAKSTKSQLFHPTEKLIESNKIKKKKGIEYRKINKNPYKVLDAPNLQDDFYLNLLQWSSKNILAVALESSLYLWNANNNNVLRFCDVSPSVITSISWNMSGNQVGIGTNEGIVDIWDLTKATKIQTLHGHHSRVSSLAYSSSMLATGSRDRSILLRDPRQSGRQVIATLKNHTQQVCGLKWSYDGNSLASGGNDNKLFIWNVHSQIPVYKLNQHTAAVKGLAWSPHNHGVLASGGGSADRTIKFWNTYNGSLMDSIDTGSQVCNLIFSKTTKQLVSTHGYSNNEVIIWKYPTLEKVATLTGHSSRVLYLSINPTGQIIVTGAGDDTLRFWNAFPSESKPTHSLNNLSMVELR